MSEAADVFLPGRDGYVVLDTESQGYARFCPIEIALARFSPEGVLLDSYSTLVKPRVSRVSRVVTELTGITTEMVRSAPTPREVMGPVRDFIGGSVIVGHDVGANDISIIDHFCQAYFGEPLRSRHVDTLYWSRALFPDLGHYNLRALAEYFGVEPENYHRALDDCLTTSRVYQKLLAAAEQLAPRQRSIILNEFVHRNDAKEKKSEERHDRPRVRRPLDYAGLPVYTETKKTAAFAHLAVLHIGHLTPEGARRIDLFVRGDAPQTESFISAHDECGWTADAEGVLHARSMSVASLNKLGRVLRADGCRLYRSDESLAADAAPQAQEPLVPRAVHSRAVSVSRSHRHIAEPPVEIVPEGDGYDVVFVDASRGVPAEWLEKQLGVRRENFFRFHVSGDFALSPYEMQKKLARLGWQSAVRDE